MITFAPSRIFLPLSILVSLMGAAEDSPNPYPPIVAALAQKIKDVDLRPLVTEANKTSVEIIPIATKDDLAFVGAEQRILIHAPLAKVEAKMADLENYPKFFPDVVSSHVYLKTDSVWDVQLEQRVDSPFASNEMVDLHYDLTGKAGEWKLYVYKLTKGQKLIYSDGFIFLRALGPGETMLIEVDFWKAKLGFFASLIKKTIWRSSLKGFAVSNLALRVACEANDPITLDAVKSAIAPFVREFDFRKLYDEKVDATDWTKEFPKAIPHTKDKKN